MKRLGLLASLLAIVASGCAGETDAPAGDGSRPPQVTVYARNLPLFPGPERAVRLGIEPFEDLVHVLPTFAEEVSSKGTLALCPLPHVDAPLPAEEECTIEVRSGVRVPLRDEGMRAFAVVLREGGEVTLDLVVQYDEGGRALAARLPYLRARPGGSACDDNACNPYFEMQPVHAGAFTARARWDGPPATLILYQGGVLGRSQTATGQPYRVPAREDGASPLRVATQLGAPAEYALAFLHATGTRATTDLEIEASWPRAARRELRSS